MITIFKNIKATSTGFVRHESIIFDRVRHGNSDGLISEIRAEKNKEKRDLLKQELPSICFSGEFKNRSQSGLIKHSGLICLDFDNCSPEELQELRDTIEGDSYTYACFVSPSGEGLKVIVKIPASVETHKQYFNSLKEYYNNEHFDISCSDVSRVCYESHDPNIYVNPDSLVFDKLTEPELEDLGEQKVSIPEGNSYVIIQNLRKWWDNKYGFVTGQRNENLIKLAYAFNDFGINQTEAEAVFSEFISSDFPKSEVETILRSAYSKKEKFGTKFFEDYGTKNSIKKDIINGKPLKEIKAKYNDVKNVEKAIDSIKDTINEDEFWTINDKGKCNLVHHKFKNYLQSNKIFKYYPTPESFVFVKIIENKVTILTKEKIKDFVLADLLSREGIGFAPYDMMASATRYFKEDYLSFLDSIDINLKEDTQTEGYLYFKNCVLRITKKGIETIDYINLDGYVWENQIIDREYKQIEGEGMYYKFINFLSGQDPERFASIRSSIGYLMHGFKTSVNNKAIILNDEVISENPNGGSGKGLYAQGLSKMKKIVTMDGKQFSFDKSFVYQRVTPDCQVLVFDDVKKNFDFERLFSVITEGIEVERKNMDALQIPVSKSPKVLITTNYTIGGVGGSFERRKFELEFSSYFNENHSPLDEFNCMLFDDWSQEEWFKFDCFMIQSLQYYLENGLVQSSYNNLMTRKFIKETSHDFYEWSKDGNLNSGERHYNNQMYERFLDEYPDYKKWLNNKRFSLWVVAYSKFIGKEYSKGRDNMGRYIEIHEDKVPF
ncbi:MAG: primase C-terminal domain-containing protein [Cytophagales bacterium]|nr:primase C-terminal domain-containing protein [Cytophagales bacterium]